MNSKPFFLICTRDEELRQRLEGYLRLRGDLCFTASVDEAAVLAETRETSVLLLDLRMPDSVSVVARLERDIPACVLIALAEPKSAPALEAERYGFFCLLPLEPERELLQRLCEWAYEHSVLRQENEMHRKRNGHAAASEPMEREHRDSLAKILLSLQYLPDASALLDAICARVAEHFSASSAGLFLQEETTSAFRLCSAIRLPARVREMTYVPEDSFPGYLTSHPHALIRRMLPEVVDVRDSILLSAVMGDMGADVILPLVHDYRLIGWLLLGPPATGRLYTENEIQELMAFASPLADTISLALKQGKESCRQKVMESALNLLPHGLLALGPDRKVLWANPKFLSLLNQPAAALIGQSVEKLGSEISGFVRRQHHSQDRTPSLLLKRDDHRLLRLTILARESSGLAEGTTLLCVEDVTASEEVLRQERRLQRAEVRAEVLSNLSFEIRSPLTAIRAFTQLLPERADDPEFIAEFGSVVEREVERLDGLSESLMEITPMEEMEGIDPAAEVDVAQALELAVRMAGLSDCHELSRDEQLPIIQGAKEFLAGGLACLMLNALEMTDPQSDSNIRIRLTCRNILTEAKRRAVYIGVRGQRRHNFPIPESSAKELAQQDLRLGLATSLLARLSGTLNIERTTEGTFFSIILPVPGALS